MNQEDGDFDTFSFTGSYSSMCNPQPYISMQQQTFVIKHYQYHLKNDMKKEIVLPMLLLTLIPMQLTAQVLDTVPKTDHESDFFLTN